MSCDGEGCKLGWRYFDFSITRICKYDCRRPYGVLGVAPEAARQVIEEIKKSQWFPQALEAGMTLRNLVSGVFKPD